MGIKDLLRFVKPYIESIHIKKYAGKRVGIDAYSWLHKGAYSCSMELSLDSDGIKKLKYIDYFMHRINLLRHYKITPVVVFDGASIPCKAATEDERHRRRKANRELAMSRLKDGDVKAASEMFQRAISITPAMAHQLIQILKSENIEFIVAPYEADAQLAYLANLEANKGGIAAVITEDSDLLAYGCRAIVFKMDRFGNGEELILDSVFSSATRKPSFQQFDKELFTGMCVLAGCDFLPSVAGIGIVKAHTLVSKYRNLDRVLSVLKLEKGDRVPEEYSKSFREAVAVFQHALVYDPRTKKVKHMKPVPQELLQSLNGELDFLGPEFSPSIASAIAEGKLDPISMEAFHTLTTSHDIPDRAVQRSGSFKKTNAALLPVRAASLAVSSGGKTWEPKELRGTDTSIPVVTQRKRFKEDAELHKLIISLPEQTNSTAEDAHLRNDTKLKVPDNNPFKKRKADTISMANIQESVSEAEPVSESLSVPSFNGDIHIENEEKSMVCSTQVSTVTETEVSETSCLDANSQESVSSKQRKTSGPKGRSKHEKLKSSCKVPVSKNTSILTFFSRV